MHTQELNFPNPADVDLVIYHKNCPDGFGAAFAAWLRIGYQAEYVAALYGDAPPDVKGKHVAIVDFSYPRDVLEMFWNKWPQKQRRLLSWIITKQRKKH